MSDADLVTAYLAKNSITKVEAGARATTERSMYLAVRGLEEPRVLVEDAKHIDNRIRTVTDHAGREFYRNAEGEWL